MPLRQPWDPPLSRHTSRRGTAPALPADAKRRRIDVWLLAGDDLGDKLAAEGRKSHADMAVAAGDGKVAVGLGASQQGQPVRGAGAKAAPDLHRLGRLQAGEEGPNGFEDALHALPRDGDAHARALQGS